MVIGALRGVVYWWRIREAVENRRKKVETEDTQRRNIEEGNLEQNDNTQIPA
jgi:hypothetical protein